MKTLGGDAVVAKGEAEEVAPHIAAHDYTRWPRVWLPCGGARRVLASWAKRAAFVACENVALQHHCEARAERRMAACVGLENGVTETRWHLC